MGDGRGIRRRRSPYSGDQADEVLAEAARAGDDRAFAVLYQRHAPTVYDFLARTVRDRAAAQEMVQATFAHAVDHRAELDDPARVQVWLFSIAHRLAIGHLTAGRSAPSQRAEPLGPDAAVGGGEPGELAWAAASRLDGRQYAVLDLATRRQLSTGDIAEVLDIPGDEAAELVQQAEEAFAAAVRARLLARSRQRCRQLADLVPAGRTTLAPAQRATVDHHLRRCPRCRQLAAGLVAREAFLAGLAPVGLPGELARTGWSQVTERAASDAVPSAGTTARGASGAGPAAAAEAAGGAVPGASEPAPSAEPVVPARRAGAAGPSAGRHAWLTGHPVAVAGVAVVALAAVGTGVWLSGGGQPAGGGSRPAAPATTVPARGRTSSTTTTTPVVPTTSSPGATAGGHPSSAAPAATTPAAVRPVTAPARSATTVPSSAAVTTTTTAPAATTTTTAPATTTTTTAPATTTTTTAPATTTTTTAPPTTTEPGASTPQGDAVAGFRAGTGGGARR